MHKMKLLGAWILVGLMVSGCASSEYKADDTFQRGDMEKTFTESAEPLPPVPNAQQGDWYELYVAPTFTGKPRILLSSIHIADDGSIRYLFNNRSAAGHDNISAEGLYCVTGTKLLDSEGSKLKTFAYADTVNGRWIEPRKAEWQILGGSRTATDRVRRVLYDAFCLDGRAKNDDELRKRVQRYGSRRPIAD